MFLEPFFSFYGPPVNYIKNYSPQMEKTCAVVNLSNQIHEQSDD